MRTFSKVLIPTDFSQAAWNAVQLSLDMVKGKDARLTLLHVYPSVAKYDQSKVGRAKDDLRVVASIKEQMENFCDAFRKESSVKIDSVILSGRVENEIAHFLEKNQFDLIVMGVNSNGMDNQPGSHVAEVIQEASAPVLVVPNNLIPEKVAV